MRPTYPTPSTRRQRGASLIFCLVILTVLLASGVAVVRSSSTSLNQSGNLTFRRDLVNQGEQAIATVIAQFSPGGAMASGTAASVPASNYSAVRLAVNAKDVPQALLGDNAFAAVGSAANDLPGATPDVAIRYVVDRLCNAAGTATALGPTGCIYAPAAPQGGSDTTQPLPVGVTPLYRISVRVTGPRETQVFLQASFSKTE